MTFVGTLHSQFVLLVGPRTTSARTVAGKIPQYVGTVAITDA